MISGAVWVVCQNDFPAAVFSSKDKAVAWAIARLHEGAAPILHLQGPYSIDDGGHVCKDPNESEYRRKQQTFAGEPV
jgi:hypothetical protein